MLSTRLKAERNRKRAGGGGGRRANQDLTKAWKSYWKLILNNVHDLVLPDIGSYAAVSWLGDMGKTANSPLSEKFVEIIFGATRIFPMMISDSFRVDKVLQFRKALGPRLKKPRLNIHRECLRYDCKFAVSD